MVPVKLIAPPSSRNLPLDLLEMVGLRLPAATAASAAALLFRVWRGASWWPRLAAEADARAWRAAEAAEAAGGRADVVERGRREAWRRILGGDTAIPFDSNRILLDDDALTRLAAGDD